MSARRRRRSPNPSTGSTGRSKGAGLLLSLAVAVVAGVCAGTYLGRHAAIPYFTAPPVASARETAPASSRNKPSSTVETRSAKQPVRAPTLHKPVEPPPVPHPLPAKPPTSDQHKPLVRRVRGFAGEIAHTDSTTMVALTFDAGASSKPTADLLDALKSARLRVTFFLTGKWCEQNEALVRRIHDEGHEIANHTYSHLDLRTISDDAIREQMAKMDEIVLRITGEHCAPYLRPPYGGRDKRVLRIVSEAGYTPIYWSLDSWDAFKKGITSEEITERILGRVRGGDIVLMHCGSRATADALPGMVRELQSRGLQVVTVTELLKG